MIPDVSHYHPVDDWTEAKSSCDFIISKATEGVSYVDSTLDDFIAGCESHKIPYWLYAYLDDGNELAQTKFLVSTCSSDVGDYFQGYVLDVEAGNSASNVQAALDYLEGLGGRCMIYTAYSSYSTYKSVIQGRASTTAWWEARYGLNDGTYNSKYPCHDDVDLHQYTSAGTCAGISGGCDLNRITGTKSLSWFTQEEDTTTTETTTTEAEIVTLDEFKELWAEMRAELQDNDSGSWSDSAKQWAVDNGYILGNGTTIDGEENYMWEDLVTREQLVTVLYRYADQHGQI